jgi:hypothetical protein
MKTDRQTDKPKLYAPYFLIQAWGLKTNVVGGECILKLFLIDLETDRLFLGASEN